MIQLFVFTFVVALQLTETPPAHTAPLALPLGLPGRIAVETTGGVLILPERKPESPIPAIQLRFLGESVPFEGGGHRYTLEIIGWEPGVCDMDACLTVDPPSGRVSWSPGDVVITDLGDSREIDVSGSPLRLHSWWLSTYVVTAAAALWLATGVGLWAWRRRSIALRVRSLPPVAQRQEEYVRQIELAEQGRLSISQRAEFHAKVFHRLRSGLAPQARTIREAKRIINEHPVGQAVLESLDHWMAEGEGVPLEPATVEQVRRLEA